jgi:hypothetical protein
MHIRWFMLWCVCVLLCVYAMSFFIRQCIASPPLQILMSMTVRQPRHCTAYSLVFVWILRPVAGANTIQMYVFTYTCVQCFLMFAYLYLNARQPHHCTT